MNGTSSGLANGTGGTQETLEQSVLRQKVSENETAAIESYIRNTLRKLSPISIPDRAAFKAEHKQGYDQVKYSWKSGDKEYISRWHTKTPNSPDEKPASWVVERINHGVGSGKNAHTKEHYILTGKYPSGTYKWTPKSEWDAAIRARKKGTATQKQKEMLDNGHW